MCTGIYCRLFLGIGRAHNKTVMAYDIGTHISFKKNTEQENPKRTFYRVGTKILFVSFFPSLQTYTIAPA